MALSAGDKLGPYEIVGAIGQGGMGAVYRARDTRLGRDVAIKVSEQHFSERFEREARVISSLNHPNICHLYDVGDNYLVMELVEGQTLRDRIKQGAIPLAEALPYARQIAAALDAAHEHGIIHRDLKPGNVMIKDDGSVKVLDFGLAKVAPGSATASASDNPELSPTVSMAATEAGAILGTASYMAPEQARGKPVDKRADIWAFGVVLYEMVTGKRPFRGEDLTDTLAAVVKVDPDLSAAPPELQPLLEKCLEKDPHKRLRDISGVELLLDLGQGQVRATARPDNKALLQAAAALAILAAVLALWAPWRTAPVEQSLHLNVSLPPNTPVAFLKLSPDGTRLVAAFGVGLQIRRLDSPDWQELGNTQGARGPFWSPDSRFVGFVADGKLKKISAAGGPAQDLCPEVGPGSEGTWNRDGIILFTNADGHLRRVDEEGGVCTPVFDDDPNFLYSHPLFLPDGKRFLYVGRDVDDLSERGIYVAALDDPTPHRVLPDLSAAVYLPTNGDDPSHLLFRRDGALMAQAFDEGRLEPIGDPFQVASQVARTFNGTSVAASFANGTLVYLTGRENESQYTWFNRSGEELGTVGLLVEHSGVWLSPDGTTLITRRQESDRAVLWALGLEGKWNERLLPAGWPAGSPVWFPDSRRVAIGVAGPEGPAVYEKDLNTGGDPQLVVQVDPTTANSEFSDFSQDGQYVIGSRRDPKTGSDIWYIKWSDITDLSKITPFVATGADEGQARLSPDGRWIAYSSRGASGGGIFVRPFPSGPSVWRVTNRGIQPKWSADGKHLYYLDLTLNSGHLGLFEVAIEPDGSGSVRTGTPQQLFTFRGQSQYGDVFLYAPHPDGERFLVNVLSEPTPPQIHVILNWRNSVELQNAAR